MERIIIALLFRVSISDFKILNMIEYCIYIAEKLTGNPDFSDPESQALVIGLQKAADEAGKAAKVAESNATKDIKDRDLKIAALKKAYSKVAVRAEELCDNDLEKAANTLMRMRRARVVTNVVPDVKNMRAKAGKHEGEIDAVCNSAGSGLIYMWEYRKSGETAFKQADVTKTARYTFAGLESGVKYQMRVTCKHGKLVGSPSDIAECRAA